MTFQRLSELLKKFEDDPDNFGYYNDIEIVEILNGQMLYALINETPGANVQRSLTREYPINESYRLDGLECEDFWDADSKTKWFSITYRGCTWTSMRMCYTDRYWPNFDGNY